MVFCKDCDNFVPKSDEPFRFARCRAYIQIDPIDGSEYFGNPVIKNHGCKCEDFKPLNVKVEIPCH
jgi:hypothetical protein